MGKKLIQSTKKRNCGFETKKWIEICQSLELNLLIKLGCLKNIRECVGKVGEDGLRNVWQCFGSVPEIKWLWGPCYGTKCKKKNMMVHAWKSAHTHTKREREREAQHTCKFAELEHI